MTSTEAIQKANELVHKSCGRQGTPLSVRLDNGTTAKRMWCIIYGPELLYHDEIQAGGTVDGGETIVLVDDCTEEARFFSV